MKKIITFFILNLRFLNYKIKTLGANIFVEFLFELTQAQVKELCCVCLFRTAISKTNDLQRKRHWLILILYPLCISSYRQTRDDIA